MMKKLILFFLGCTILISCNNNTKNVPIIDLNKIKHAIDLDLSVILNDISFVQISSDFLFSVDDQIYVTSQFLIIYRNKYSKETASLDLFNRNGVHIRKLATRGNGPGEFSLIEDFFVDDDENILYYKDMRNRTRLFRIDLNNGITLDPLQIDFTYLTANYHQGKIYSFPDFKGWFTQTNESADSSIVVYSIALPSGEMTKYRGEHRYQFLVLGASISFYQDEIALINFGYSDTLFTFKDDKLIPRCVIDISNKMTDFEKGGDLARIISVYNNGIVLSKNNVTYQSYGERGGALNINTDYYVLYDRKGNVYKIDNTRVMNTTISLKDPEKNYLTSSLLPIICGKYGYMLVEHDVLETLPTGFDPNNDNPIIIVGEVK